MNIAEQFDSLHALMAKLARTHTGTHSLSYIAQSLRQQATTRVKSPLLDSEHVLAPEITDIVIEIATETTRMSIADEIIACQPLDAAAVIRIVSDSSFHLIDAFMDYVCHRVPNDDEATREDHKPHRPFNSLSASDLKGLSSFTHKFQLDMFDALQLLNDKIDRDLAKLATKFDKSLHIIEQREHIKELTAAANLTNVSTSNATQDNEPSHSINNHTRLHDIINMADNHTLEELEEEDALEDSNENQLEQRLANLAAAREMLANSDHTSASPNFDLLPASRELANSLTADAVGHSSSTGLYFTALALPSNTMGSINQFSATNLLAGSMVLVGFIISAAATYCQRHRFFGQAPQTATLPDSTHVVEEGGLTLEPKKIR